MNRREMVLVGVGVVFVAGAVWFALSSASGSPGKASLIPLARARSQTTESRLNARRMENEQKELAPRVAQLTYNLPAEELVPQVIHDLQGIADRAGVHLREVKPIRPNQISVAPAAGQRTRTTQTTRDVLGARVPLEVHFRAPFQPNVMRFLYEVENPTGRMVIDKIDITSADEKFKSVEVSARITVFTRSSTGTSGGDTGETSDARSNKG